jgi:hypothetical protein
MRQWIFSVLLTWSLVAELCWCFTHWRVTEHGRIEYNDDSAFTLLRPYDLASFMKQAERLKRLNVLKDLIQARDIEAKSHSRKSLKSSVLLSLFGLHASHLTPRYFRRVFS